MDDTEPTAPRRTVKRHTRMLLLAAVIALMGSLVGGIGSASAGRAWCRTDPILIIDGQISDIFVAGPLTAPFQVTGPTKINIYVPHDAGLIIAIPDLGFLKGVDMQVIRSANLQKTPEGRIPLKIEVYVPAQSSSMPIAVEFAPRVLGILDPVRVEGTANQWITLGVEY
jgi:hypothetical protein